MGERASYDWRRYIAEAIGTFALVAIGPGAVMVAARTSAFGGQGVALAFGLVVTIVVAATGHLGGAHINPAVTLGFWSVGRFATRDVVPYIFAQFVIISVATDARTPPSVAPFAIGATVFAGALVTGPLTGGSFNPARSLGPAVVGGVWTAHWLYWAAPIIGMLVAMRGYEFLRAADLPQAPAEVALGVEGPVDGSRP